MYKHLLIATDGSELADKGVAHGLTLAKGIGASVTFVTVSEQFPMLAWGGAMAGYAAGDELAVYQGFLAGGVPAEDIPEMIFLFRNFRSFVFFAEAVDIWGKADECVQELMNMSREIAVAENTAQLDDQ
eukprot:gene58425-80001_t